MTLSEMMQSVKTVNDAWNKVKVNSSNDHTFGGLVLIWKMLNKICVQRKERLEQEITDINNTYARTVADEKISNLRREHKEFIETNQKKFEERITAVCDAKTAEVDKIIAKTGDPSLIELVKGLSLRSEVSDREWQAISVRVTEGHDYQAMKLLAEVAPKLNRYYKCPFDPDEEIKEIESARDDLLHMSKIMDRPSTEWSYTEMMIMGEYDHLTANQQRFERLDTAIGVAVPRKVMTLIERLKEAQEIARDNGDNASANAISRFLYEKSEYIEDRQTVSDFYKSEAETLIHKALSSVSGSKSQEFNNLVQYFTPGETKR